MTKSRIDLTFSPRCPLAHRGGSRGTIGAMKEAETIPLDALCSALKHQ
jgi:hypothetical protein